MAGYYWDDEQDDAGRDRPLSFHWHLPDALPAGLSKPSDAAYGRVRASVLAEAILGWQECRAVSYSRSMSFYSSFGRYHGTDFTFRNVRDVIEEVTTAGQIINHQVPPGNLGWQSSFEATPALIEWHMQVATSMVYRAGEIIRLKDDDKRLMGYTDTDRTRVMRRQLAAINESLAAIRIEIPGAEWSGGYMRFGDSYVLPTPDNGLRRIFNRGKWCFGGRVYGWWQNLPKTIRRQALTLNGEGVREVDFAAMHPTMAYAQAGHKLTGCPYDIAGFDRESIKAGLLIGINAETEQKAQAALAVNLKVNHQHARRILQAIKARHKPIERWFCSDSGIRLMRLDSEIMLDSVKAINGAGYPALPIHDSLLVPAHIAELAIGKMQEAYERVLGSGNTCSVAIKG